jgi:hypothetical protein
MLFLQGLAACMQLPVVQGFLMCMLQQLSSGVIVTMNIVNVQHEGRTITRTAVALGAPGAQAALNNMRQPHTCTLLLLLLQG